MGLESFCWNFHEILYKKGLWWNYSQRQRAGIVAVSTQDDNISKLYIPLKPFDSLLLMIQPGMAIIRAVV